MAPEGKRRVCCKGQVTRNQQRAQRYWLKSQKREIDAATLITKNIRIRLAIQKVAKRKVTFALNCPNGLSWVNLSFSCDPQEIDTLYLWQEDLRKIDWLLATVEQLKSQLSPESFQEEYQRLMRQLRRDPKDVAVAQSPVAQTVDTQQVISDHSPRLLNM